MPDPDPSRPEPSGPTYHLAVRDEWLAQRTAATYAPPAFADEGFVHCTHGLDQLLVPANTYYRDDPRPYVALEVALDRITAAVRYDAEPCIYPHIYGPVDTAAVVSTHIARRDDSGRFTGFEAASDPQA